MGGTRKVFNILLIIRADTCVGVTCQLQKHMKEIQNN